LITVTEIINDVLSLPRADRGYLAQKLIESLDDERDLTDDEKATLDRRSQEMKDGTVTPLTLDQLKKQVSENRG
jgi:putative addiction module component (TIGR02574 family)